MASRAELERKRMAEIRNQWFRNHKAHIHPRGDIVVVDWMEDGTNVYAVRYVFDGANLYVSGDIGNAMFRCTWETWENGLPQVFTKAELGYLAEKLACYNNSDVIGFSGELARDELERFLAEGYVTDKAAVHILMNEAFVTTSKAGWLITLKDNEDLSAAFPGYLSEELTSVGDIYASRFLGWITGLRMIREQIETGAAIVDNICIELQKNK